MTLLFRNSSKCAQAVIVLPASPSLRLDPLGSETLQATHLHRRTSPEPLLIWVKQGQATLSLNKTQHLVQAGHAVLIAAGVEHEVHTARDTIAVPIHLSRLDSGQARTMAPLTVVKVPSSWNDRLIYEFASNLGYLRGTPRGVAALADQISQPQPDAGDNFTMPPLPHSAEAFRVAHHILNHPESHEAASALAQSVGLSERTMQRRFADETGMTLSQWRSRARIWSAAGYLSAGREIGWVAHRVGYENLSAFARSFRGYTGLSPREFRAQALTPPLPPRGTKNRQTLRKNAPAVSEGLSQLTQDSAAAEFSLHAGQLHTRLAQAPPAIPPTETWPRINGAHVAVWMYCGTAKVTIADRVLELNSGDALILPAGFSNHIEISAGSLLLPAGFRASGGVLLDPHTIGTTHFSPEECVRVLHQIVSTYTVLRPSAHVDTELFDLIAARSIVAPDLNVRHNPHIKPAQAIAELLAYLAVNPHDVRPLSAWAQTLGSRSTDLNRAFVVQTGMDFRRWTLLSRMTHAREQLLRAVPISVVSRNLGYSHTSAFSRAFTAAHGMSPHDFITQKEHTSALVARKVSKDELMTSPWLERSANKAKTASVPLPRKLLAQNSRESTSSTPRIAS